MVKTFNVEKRLFKGHFHERDQFLLNYDGNDYRGIYHNGTISWFHPQPLNDLEKDHFINLEEKVHKKMQA